MKVLAAALLALWLAGCAALPAAVPPADQAAPREAGADLIVLAVADPVGQAWLRAGSTPAGYDAMPVYAGGDAAQARLAALARDFGLRQLAAWPIEPLQLHCAVFAVAGGDARDAVLRRLAADPRVRLAQPLQQFRTLSATFGTAYNDPYLGLQRGFAGIDAGGAQQWSRGAGVRVAVVDTGADAGHPDLRGRVALQRNFVDDDSAGFLRDRHGTEVSGVIAADANNAQGIVGVAPEAQLVLLKACWQLQPQADAAQCNSFTLAQALTAAIQARAQVINLSLGGPPDPLLARLLDYALRHGALVVGAVPPDGRLDGFPLEVPGVIAVDGAERPSAAAGTLRAPGRDILTLTPGGRYDFASGSSLAAAHVSGTLALMLAQRPQLDAAAALALLRQSSTADSAPINACAALAAMHGRVDCTAGIVGAAGR